MSISIRRRSAWRPLQRGVCKTLSTPFTYAGALLVGGLSLAAADTEWGAAVPFLAPLLVQSLARTLAELEDARLHEDCPNA